ncbi:threonine synthase [Guptibacillus hwajinpoensis]|uniref:Threonine synthase n=2 Tax=Guptibacillus hwajinpoensis TaxID=208199 RepID=A0ABU0K0C6_9BACL|nr:MULTISPECIES: threonine synthase [Alkalihalobacillus]KMM38758.1 threonine synthase [Alkalihalobacillus macyae]MDP4553088.1 threonine synthase [Alkalihalobacillus macyae]MDQ0482805.1 threonine synthase [Alkalihalobacillus hemicentroti]
MNSWNGLLKQYKDYLPISENTPGLSLNEGNTPLLKLDQLSQELGISLYVKIEGANPTGSFKDRGMVMAVAKAKEDGSDAIICASTGNTAAAAAAYGARAGLRCIIVIPKGKVALGKLAQAMIYGAEIFEIDGNFDEALRMVRNIAETEPIALVNSVNPYRLEGQKTAAFEVCDQLGKAPDVLAIPVGNAGNISAYWKGFKEYVNDGKRPQMRGFEAEGSAAIVQNRIIPNPETVATAIRIGNPASWHLAEEAVLESQGKMDFVTDEEILDAYQELAKKEGVFAEPASCASVAGVMKQVASGEIEKGSSVVAVLTGNGLKDPSTAMDNVLVKPRVVEADKEKFMEELKGCVSH